VLRSVVLVIALGVEEFGERHDLRRDRRGEDLRVVELTDVARGDVALRVVGVKNRRTILAAAVVALAIDLGRIVGDGEEHLEQLTVTDASRIEADRHRFRMIGRAAADAFVVRTRRIAAAVAGGDFEHTVEFAEHRFHAPEAAAREHGARFACVGCGIERGIGHARAFDGETCAGNVADEIHGHLRFEGADKERIGAGNLADDGAVRALQARGRMTSCTGFWMCACTKLLCKEGFTRRRAATSRGGC
jgi:hypothetical protein